MGDFNSRNSSSDKRNRKNFFSKTGNSATEMHKLLSMKWLAKWADIPQMIIKKAEQKKKFRDMIEKRPQNKIIIKKEKSYDQWSTKNSQETTIKENKFSKKQEELLYYLWTWINKKSHWKKNTKEIVYQIIQDKDFLKTMYTNWIKKNINQVTNNLLNILEPYSVINSQTKNLIHKFIPHQRFSNKHFLPIWREIWNLWPLLSNFVENLIFCELLVQCFSSDINTNIISINDKNYTIYVGSIQEDINWIDITLIDNTTQDYIGIDITRNTSKKTNFIGTKATKTHKDILIFNYSKYEWLFRHFMKPWIEYLKSSTPWEKPIVKKDTALMSIKWDIRSFMESYQEHQKNNSSDWDQNTDSNVETDESNSHHMTSW